MWEVVRAYQTTAAEVVRQYEGHMAQYLGDGLLIYFGWPRAHEDDAQRSLHAGLDIVEAITTRLNPRLEREKSVQLTVRLGIHTGPVVVGEMGGGDRHENLATGETVNIAARLEGLAAPNTVMISNVTARLVRGAFILEDMGPQTLKGVAEPMPVFRVLGPMEIHDDETGAVGVPFLVGRDEEMGLLLRRWEQAKESLGQAILLSGEAGIGKSSLVAAIRTQVLQEGHTRLAFRCSPYHTNSALYPVVDHLQRMLQFQPGDAPETKLDKLERLLNGYSRPLDEVVSLFADLLSLPLPQRRYATPNLTPQQQRQQTQDTLVAWMVEAAERQPTLVVWEDLHWVDPSTLEILGLLLEQTPTVPMLHVLTFRPEFEPPWPLRSHLTPMTLNRLEQPQVEALITQLASGKRLPHEVMQHIVTKTDGVPLYVEELTKMLLDSGLLREEADRYDLTGPLLNVAIPDTLQDSLMARLDRLNTAKEVAQLGAVIGREFPYDLLQVVSSQDETTLQSGLAQLVDAELLYQRGRSPRARYIFKHALIQDTAYTSLLRSTRQQTHHRIAQVLEEQFPDTAEMQPDLLAHHLTEAGLQAQAIGYWQQAGQIAIHRSANVEAISHLMKGLELLNMLPETPERDQQELVLQTALGPALMAAKGWASPEVEQAYARARQLCSEVEASSQLFNVVWGLWRFYLLRGELRTAPALADQLLKLARHLDEIDLLIEAHRAVGQTQYYLGDFDFACTTLQQGCAMYIESQHRSLGFRYGTDPKAQSLSVMAWALWFRGYPEEAVFRSQEGLAFARQLSHPHTLAQILFQTARLHQLRRSSTEVQALAEEVIALAIEQGFPFFVALGTLMQGWALATQGRQTEGIEQIQQGLDAFQATGAGLARPSQLAHLAAVYKESGQPEKGLRLLSEALAFVQTHKLCYDEADMWRLKGTLRLAQSMNDHPKAESCYHKALDIARRQQAKSLELRAATSMARLWQSQGKRQEAYDLLSRVYGWFTEGFDTADLKDAKTLLDELA